MIVRAASPTDAQAICDIWNPIIRDTTVTFTDEAKTPPAISDLIKLRAGAFLVAEHGGKVGGFATYFAFRGGSGYLRSKELSINLAPDMRGQGMGRALINALEAHAREQGVHSLIGAVSSENPAGQTFHHQLGYRHIATLPEVGFKFGRYIDLILMQKILTSTDDIS
ncbi:GNAT family N-acetyltransferase [Planktotalea sp.]|uniref:GNAT family N-acetyltransferase n=1 Tax=Planktotalea sp. TaxID=2029877 RepID=UPI0035C84542